MDLRFGAGTNLGLGHNCIDVSSDTSTYSDRVIAIAGCSCSGSTGAVSQLATNFKVPMVSGMATSPDLSDNVRHPYFSRVVPTDSKQAVALAALVEHYGWQKATRA